MTEDEIELVAAELAKAGGHSWYPGREKGPLKVISDRYRDRARLAIAALDRFRASKQGQTLPATPDGALSSPRAEADESVAVGRTVLYRPPGDQRSYPCRVERIEGRRVYLVPDIKHAGWVDIDTLLPRDPEPISAS